MNRVNFFRSNTCTEKPFVSEIRDSEPVIKGDQTVLRFENEQLAALPNFLLDQNLLEKYTHLARIQHNSG
jgi:hypothetical protein